MQDGTGIPHRVFEAVSPNNLTETASDSCADDADDIEDSSSDSEPLHVCVVGAGVSGIVTAKWLLQCGLKVTILDANETLGGIWKYSV
ncbi:hypothetical protein SARC_13452, partial [Sphaeroforma arctica JP610]